MSNVYPVTIYALSSSEDGLVRYVGQTGDSITRRLVQHKAEANRSDYRVSRWIRKAIKNGFEINIEILEENACLDVAEIEWIRFYRSFCSDLTNTHNGGRGGSKGVKRSDEVRARMCVPRSEATKAKMRKPKSESTKIKMSKAQIGNIKSRGESNRHAVLTEDNVLHIKNELLSKYSLSEIASRYNVNLAAISKIKTGRNWSHV